MCGQLSVFVFVFTTFVFNIIELLKANSTFAIYNSDAKYACAITFVCLCIEHQIAVS